MTTTSYKNDQGQDDGAGLNSNTIEYDDKTHRIVIMDTASPGGRYIYLSERDQRELALSLLERTHKVTFSAPESQGGWIRAEKREKPRPPAEVGQFYRVKGEPNMCGTFPESPIVRVAQVSSPGYIHVRTANGDQSGWHWPAENLVGPIPADEVLDDFFGSFDTDES